MAMRDVRLVIATALAVVLAVLSCSGPADAANDGALVTTILPALAQRVEKAKPDTSFPGADLAIAADARKNPTKQAYLRFSLDTLPKDATIVGWTLRLHAPTRSKARQLVRVFPATFDTKLSASPLPALTWNAHPRIGARAVGSAEVHEGRVDFVLVTPDKDAWGKGTAGEASLMLQSVTASLDQAYQGSCALPNPCVNTQPRLIVRYVMPLAAPTTAWPQARHDAQQSGRTPWTLSAAVEKVADPVPLYTPKGYVGFSPVLAGRSVILYTDRTDKGSARYFVTAVDRTGAAQWDTDVDIKAAAKFAPVYDGRDGVWIVTENDLHLVQLRGRAPTLVTYPLAKLLGRSDVSVRAPPTLGANRALYLSTNRGLFALAPHPDLRVVWRHGGDTSQFGQVALSADEATAYVVDGAAAGAVVGVDTTDGHERWRQPATIDEPRTDALAVPAVATVSEKEATTNREKAHTLVYVVSGDTGGTSLRMFDGDTGNAATATAFDAFSRPVIAGNGRAWFITRTGEQPGRVCRYYWEFWNATAPVYACEPGAGENLSTRSALAMDGSDTLYVVDGIGTTQRVRAYDASFASRFTLDVTPTGSLSPRAPDPARPGPSTNFGDNVVVAPGGTLFLTNANALFAIEPKQLSDSAPATLTLDAGALTGTNQRAFLATQIGVANNVTIHGTQNLVLRASTIRFGRQFKVEKGAELTCGRWTPSP
jgi:outer membrane protein assembly factor BamB